MEKKGIRVLSLFDGIATARVALEILKIPVAEYHASEVDEAAIKIAKKNWPDVVEIGDVREVDGTKYEGIDLLCFGSPCQSFSFAGKRAGMATKENLKVTTLEQYLDLKKKGTEFEGQSYLFWEAVRILKESKPKYFLMENVVMAKEWEAVITNALGVEPIKLDSASVAAAPRKRLYWTNIPSAGPLPELNVTFGDVRECGVDPKDVLYYSPKAFAFFAKATAETGRKLRIIGDGDKMQMLEASMCKTYSRQRMFGIEDVHGIRYVTPTECERCMNLPDGYTAGVSRTQRYKALGNGWEARTITHLFSGLPAA